MEILQLFKALHSTYFLRHNRLQNSFKATAFSSIHFLKSIREGSLYCGPFEIIERILDSEMIFKFPVIIWPAGS